MGEFGMRAVPVFFRQFLWQECGVDLGLQETIQRNHERKRSRDLFWPQSVQELELHQPEPWKETDSDFTSAYFSNNVRVLSRMFFWHHTSSREDRVQASRECSALSSLLLAHLRHIWPCLAKYAVKILCSCFGEWGQLVANF